MDSIEDVCHYNTFETYGCPDLAVQERTGASHTKGILDRAVFGIQGKLLR